MKRKTEAADRGYPLSLTKQEEKVEASEEKKERDFWTRWGRYLAEIKIGDKTIIVARSSNNILGRILQVWKGMDERAIRAHNGSSGTWSGASLDTGRDLIERFWSEAL